MSIARIDTAKVVTALGILFAMCMGAWLAHAACFITGLTRSFLYVVFALALLAVMLVPFPSPKQVPLRIVKVIGLLVVVALVRALAYPLFPSIYYGHPISLESYWLSVHLDMNEPFGPCFASDSYNYRFSRLLRKYF